MTAQARPVTALATTASPFVRELSTGPTTQTEKSKLEIPDDVLKDTSSKATIVTAEQRITAFVKTMEPKLKQIYDRYFILIADEKSDLTAEEKAELSELHQRLIKIKEAGIAELNGNLGWALMMWSRFLITGMKKFGERSNVVLNLEAARKRFFNMMNDIRRLERDFRIAYQQILDQYSPDPDDEMTEN